MWDNRIIVAFALSTFVIVYYAFATLIQPTSAQRIEREYGVPVVKWK